MCFSPQADLVGGAVVTLLGVDAIRHVRVRGEIMLAALPLLFGAHQLVETLVWWWLQGDVSEAVGRTATWIYLLFAFVVLPPYVPLAIRAIEPTPGRRRLMNVFVAIGAVVAAVLLAAMLRGPVSATLETRHLAYTIGLSYGGWIVSAYVVSTCGSLLLSGYRHIVLFGLVNLPVIAVLALLAQSGLASLWCAWAAITSGLIVMHLRYGRMPELPRPPARVPVAS